MAALDLDDFLSFADEVDEEPGAAAVAAESARDAALRAGDRRAQAAALLRGSEAQGLLGKAEEAMASVQEALDICEDMRLEVGRGAALAAIARLCAAHGASEDDAELGFDSAEDAVRYFRKSGVKRGEAVALWSSARMEVAFGTPRRAVQFASDAVALLQDLADSALEARVCQTLSDGYLAAGDARRAAKAVERARAIQEALGDKRKEGACWHSLATIELRGFEPEAATELLEQARQAFRAAGDYKGEARVLDTQVDVQLGLGRVAAAVDVAKERVSHFHAAGDRGGEGRALLKLAELLVEHDGDARRAERIAEAAAGILAEAQDREGLTLAHETTSSLQHSQMRREMAEVLEQNRGFMHVPKHPIVDPGLNKRTQQCYGEALRSGLF